MKRTVIGRERLRRESAALEAADVFFNEDIRVDDLLERYGITELEFNRATSEKIRRMIEQKKIEDMKSSVYKESTMVRTPYTITRPYSTLPKISIEDLVIMDMKCDDFGEFTVGDVVSS